MTFLLVRTWVSLCVVEVPNHGGLLLVQRQAVQACVLGVLNKVSRRLRSFYLLSLPFPQVVDSRVRSKTGHHFNQSKDGSQGGEKSMPPLSLKNMSRNLRISTPGNIN